MSSIAIAVFWDVMLHIWMGAKDAGGSRFLSSYGGNSLQVVSKHNKIIMLIMHLSYFLLHNPTLKGKRNAKIRQISFLVYFSACHSV
jgi:hypothetical protein